MNIVVIHDNHISYQQSTVLLDEAKIREDARNVHQKCLEKQHQALKEENKKVRQTIQLSPQSANSFKFGLH